MKQSKLFIPTLKEAPRDAEILSHKLLVRAGYIRQSASGVYSFLPLGKMVLNQLYTITHEEHQRIGANDCLFPTLQADELWKSSGRYDKFGPEMMRIHDRNEREFILGPTHEEVVHSLVKETISSYKQLPLSVYQIQTKFRDERRPRFGLLRGKEFIMKDAYSFHATQDSLEETYRKYYDCYSAIFTRAGLNFVPVEADTGAIGGSESMEFMALSSVGEDVIAHVEDGSYAANVELAKVYYTANEQDSEVEELKKVQTFEMKTIDELAEHFQVDKAYLVKAVAFINNEERIVLAIVPGNREVNEIKVRNLVGGGTLRPATTEELRTTGLIEGVLSPIGLSEDIVSKITIICDDRLRDITNGMCGANVEGYHYSGFNFKRDLQCETFDLVEASDGDYAEKDVKYVFDRGIELGHIFKPEQHYSIPMDVHVLNEQGRKVHVYLGTYGIGISRMLAAIVEQHGDEKGIVWPMAVAPYHVHIVALDYLKDEEKTRVADMLYEHFTALGFRVLLDDRNERPGVKFTEAELLGMPHIVHVGRGVTEGKIEYINRHEKTKVECTIEELMSAKIQ